MKNISYKTKLGIRDALIDHVLQSYYDWCFQLNRAPLLLYITLVFNGRSDLPNVSHVSEASTRALRLDYVKRHFDRAYKQLLKVLLGSHYSRKSKRHMQPRAWVFADLPGTKPAKSRINSKIGSPRLGLHIHAVILLHPETPSNRSPSEISKLLTNACTKAVGTALQSIDVRTIGVQDIERAVRNLISYSCHLMFRSLAEVEPTDVWDMWPQ